MKAIAKTIGAIELVDPQIRDYVRERPAVVVWTQFKEARTGKGQIKILEGNLPMEADDAEFQKFLKDSKTEEQAVAAYVSTFEVEKEQPKQKKTSKKPTKKED